MGEILNKSPLLFFWGLGLTVAYIPGILGAAVPTGWFYLIISAPILFCFVEFKLGFGFLFLVLVAISLAWTENINIGVFALAQLLALGCVICVASEVKDLRPILKGLSFGLGVSSILAIMQYNGFNSVYTNTDEIAGLFVNKNILCEMSVVILLLLATFKLWYWVPVTLPGIVLVHSRAAMLILVAGLFMWLYKINRLYALIGIGVSAVGLFCLYKFTGNYTFNSSYERVSLWADTIHGFKIFGNGVGSFEILYPYYATNIDTSIARPRYAHNDLLQLIFEYGIFTLLLIPLIVKVICSASNIKYILYAMVLLSMFSYPLHIPISAFVACLLTGYLISNNVADGGTRNYRRSALSKRG